MKFKILLLTFFMAVAFTTSTVAQNLKIGYFNLELAMLYMNETKSMNQQLQTFGKKLGEQLEIKQTYAQGKLNEYIEKKTALEKGEPGAPSEAQLKALEDELMKLDGEITKYQQESQEKMAKKQQDLMDPILEKLQNAIETVAAEGNYDYIFNTVDGSGVSVVLHGPEQHDLTKTVLTKLGVKIPEE